MQQYATARFAGDWALREICGRLFDSGALPLRGGAQAISDAAGGAQAEPAASACGG